jgi:hypothetical protein
VLCAGGLCTGFSSQSEYSRGYAKRNFAHVVQLIKKSCRSFASGSFHQRRCPCFPLFVCSTLMHDNIRAPFGTDYITEQLISAAIARCCYTWVFDAALCHKPFVHCTLTAPSAHFPPPCLRQCRKGEAASTVQNVRQKDEDLAL